MGADFVEQDLAVTKDGVLICLHDPTLERTTNVEELFPDRATHGHLGGQDGQGLARQRLHAAEIKQLDAGSWFDPKFKGERIPDLRRSGRARQGQGRHVSRAQDAGGLSGRDVDFETLVAAALDKHGLRGPKADPKTPIILQTFSESSAKKLAAMKIGVPVVLLLSNGDGLELGGEGEGVEGLRAGPRPGQGHRRSQPGLREVGACRGHDGHALHVPRRRTPEFPNVKAEMEHFLYTLGVDGLFTDNPDQFPRK